MQVKNAFLPCVDAAKETNKPNEFLISFFPPYLLVSDGYLVSPAAVYPGGYCFGPRWGLSSGSRCHQQCLFFMLF